MWCKAVILIKRIDLRQGTVTTWVNFFNAVTLHFSPVDQDKVEIVSGQASNFIPDVCKQGNPWFSWDSLSRECASETFFSMCYLKGNKRRLTW